jgi:hypothetical protein
MTVDLVLEPVETKTRISAEARGLARDFCRRVGQEARLINEQAIGAPLRRRIARYPDRRPRDCLLRDLEREWRAANPQHFRLEFQSEWRGKNFFIRERAVTVVEAFRLLHWDDDDHGVSVMDTWMRVERDRVTAGVQSRMWIGSHALARWYQRSGARSDERLLRDIGLGGVIDTNDRDAFPDLDDVRVPISAAGEGWRGAMMLPPEDEDGGSVFYVRTFV